MKKVININFQGRVLPIEETAYEMLQTYIASLRTYFANEEGRDEIINDIENRIAELFGEKLKAGANCITDEHVDAIMRSVGRPQDFEQVETETADTEGLKTQTEASSTSGNWQDPYMAAEPRRLYRNEKDKVIGGVASGLANYLRIDPVVVRLLFVLLVAMGGSGILVYIVLWMVLPSRSLVTNIRKRLYRDTDDRIIAGVAGGLAKYFDLSPAVPRIIFVSPLILSILANIFNDHGNWGWSFGWGTLVTVYIVMWIVVPEARTTSEKLEMRGEKVDLNSIKETVVSDLQGVKDRATRVGKDLTGSALKVGSEVGGQVRDTASYMMADLRQASRRTGGLGNIIAILAKAFVYFIGGLIAFSLLIAFVVILGAGVNLWPWQGYLFENGAQQALGISAGLLFFGVPVIAMLVWVVRRLMGVRSTNKVLGYSFLAMWIFGLILFLGTAGSLRRSFGTQVGVRQDIELKQPVNNQLYVDLATTTRYFDDGINFDGLANADADTLFLNTAKVNVVKSKDDLYRIHLLKISKGNGRRQAQALAEKIDFNLVQNDSLIILPESFKVTKKDTWRNQRVYVVIEVPVGKKIRIDRDVRDYNYFNFNIGSRNRWRNDWNRDWEDGEYWQGDADMLMTNDGLKELDSFGNPKDEEHSNNDENEPLPDHDSPASNPSKKSTEEYRFEGQPKKQADTLTIKTSVTTNNSKRVVTPLASVIKLF